MPTDEKPAEKRPEIQPVDIGRFVGILVGEGHFGGDGKQPQVTLRMHTRHETLFRWIERTFPGGRLYGPYEHGGRRYYQWMARGAYLRTVLAPLLSEHLTEDFDAYAYGRFADMCERYSIEVSAGSDAPAALPRSASDGP